MDGGTQSVAARDDVSEQIPIACLLPDATRQAREEEIAAAIFSAVLETRELPDGYSYRFQPGGEIASTLLQFIMFERECCPFFTFDLRFEPGGGPIWLTLRGPEGTKEFLESFAAGNAPTP
jgi:hypothetical protein